MRAYENIPLKQIAISGYDLEANGHQAGRLRANQHSRNQSRTYREMNSKPIEIAESDPAPNGIHDSFRQYKESTIPKSNHPSPHDLALTQEQVNHSSDKRVDEMQRTIATQEEEIAYLRQQLEDQKNQLVQQSQMLHSKDEEIQYFKDRIAQIDKKENTPEKTVDSRKRYNQSVLQNAGSKLSQFEDTPIRKNVDKHMSINEEPKVMDYSQSL